MDYSKIPVIWLTGLSGSGKSTIAEALERKLSDKGLYTRILDGDNIRKGLSSDLGFSDEDRKENIRRIGEVARLFSESGVHTITAFISPFEEERTQIRQLVGEDLFVEVHIATSLEVCEGRDPKGLYKKARAGEIPKFTGIDSPYEKPSDPDLMIHTHNTDVDECVEKIIQYLVGEGFID